MKTKQVKKPTNRIKQRARLTLANPDFQKNVAEIRERFSIPQEGIKDNDQSEKWHHNFYLSNDEYFEKNISRIKIEELELEKGKKFKEAFNLRRQFNKDAPINALDICIKKILEKHRLPLGWHHSIQRYILFNNLDSMWIVGNVTVREDFDLDTDLVQLSIGIDDSTRLEDIKKAWSRIKFHQKRLASYTKKKFQPIKNFDRDKEAYELSVSNKSNDEISDILSEKYDKNYTYVDVASFIKRHKQKIGIN